MKLDWISATFPDGYTGSPVDLFLHLADEPPTRVRGMNAYGSGVEIRHAGSVVATVYEGPGLPPHVKASGANAAPVGAILRRSVPGYRVARADVAVDYLGGRPVFDSTCQRVLDVVAGKVGTRTIDSHTPAGSPAGSTLYVGSSTSETMLRVYEKGLQDRSYDPSTVRVELQVRPASRPRKEYAGTLEPAGFWGMSRWSRSVASELLSVDAPAAPARPARVSDLQRSLDAMALQYGRRILELLDVLDGDVAELGSQLVARALGQDVPDPLSCDCSERAGKGRRVFCPDHGGDHGSR